MKTHIISGEDLIKICMESFETGVKWAAVFVEDGTGLNTRAQAELIRQYKNKLTEGLETAGKL